MYISLQRSCINYYSPYSLRSATGRVIARLSAARCHNRIMTTPTLSHIVDTFHGLYPPHLAASWDSSGLVCGRLQAPVEHVHFAVDAISATAQEAVNLGAGLLITHHPLLLRGTSFIPDSDYKGNVLHTLIEGGCGLLGAHTNADAAVAGVNEALCEALNLQGCEPLTDQQQQELAGEEYCVGTGRVGVLARPLTLQELSEELAAALPATAGGLRVAGSPQKLIRRVALCGGAGDSLFEAVRASEADVYITADLRHHPASEFREQELVRGTDTALIDCSHAASESLWLNRAAERLQETLAGQGYSIEISVSSLNTDPWDFHVDTGQIAGSASTPR